jgi:hypothetical protein
MHAIAFHPGVMRDEPGLCPELFNQGGSGGLVLPAGQVHGLGMDKYSHGELLIELLPAGWVIQLLSRTGERGQ